MLIKKFQRASAKIIRKLAGSFLVRWVTQPILRFNTAQLKTSFTDLKELNNELISGKQQLHQFLEALPIGVAVFNKDSQVSYANQMAKDIICNDIDLNLSLKNRSILQQIYQAGTEELYPEENLPYVRALQGETVVVDDMEIRRKGQIISLEMRTVPVFNSQGKVAYAIAAFHEITDRKRIEVERQKAEKALRESEQRYADLAKAAPVGIFRNDLQGNCLYGNERSFAMIGVTEKEAFGAGWAQSLHPDDRDRVISAWYDFVQKHIPFNCEYRFQKSDGNIIWVFGQAVAEKDTDGNIVGYVGTITDISERKQAEKLIENYNRILENQVAQRTAELAQTNAQLEQEISDRKQAQTELEKAKEIAEAANRAKSTFLANMSHELRTPLNAILGFSQLMSHEKNLSPEQQEKITIIRRSGEHLLTLINQVLDLSKIEAGRMTLMENEFDLYRLLNEVELMFSLKAQEKNLKLELKYDANVPQYICTDEVKLRQILINLLNNAIKFTEEGSVIVKTSMPDANQILFAVIDTGVGISAEEIPNLFKPFVQTSSGKQIQEGTGLGLTISYQFIRLMGGEINVISGSKIFTPGTSIQDFEPTTTGTTFQFSIPVKVSDGKYVYQKSLKCQNITIAPHQTSYRMLVVDDNDYNCQLLVNLLKSLGFELQVAKNGYEAIEIWENFRPHLIWMDMRMPVMDGHQATQEIRLRESKIIELSRNSLHSPTVIIALTAGVLNDNKGAALISGCNGFVSKPFQEEDIFEVLQTYLNLSFVCHNPIINHEPKLAASPKLSPASLRNLPKQLVTNLNYAITIGDWEEMHLVVEQVKLHDENLADQLLTLLNEYKFQELLVLTNQESS
jgi:PAS domain S-box-containing protein